MPLAFLANLIQIPSEVSWCSSSHASNAAALSNGIASSSTPHRLAEERPRDDEPLDLRGPLVDLRDLGVAVVALGRELLRVAVAAEDLDRLAGLRPGHAAREQLCLRPLDGVRAARVLQARGAPRECPRGLDLRLHVGELLLDRAEPRDRAAERVALLRIGGGQLERRLRD